VRFDQMEHVVDAVLPTREQASLLHMEVTQPCLLLTRRTWMRETPITLVRCLHPGTRYHLGSRMRTDGNAVTS
jgi:GntR family histidine utilization transcriptional repressor